MQVSLLQSTEGLDRRNRQRKGEFPLCLPVFEVGHQSFPAFRLGFGLEFTPLALLVLRPSDLEWYWAISPARSPACQLQVLGLLSLQICTSQFLGVSPSLYSYLYVDFTYFICIIYRHIFIHRYLSII